MLRINLATLIHSTVGWREAIVIELDTLAIDELQLRALQGELQATRVAHGILLEGKLQATVQTECIRCLTPFFLPIVIEFEDTIGLPGATLTQERPVRAIEDGWADLSPLIREYAWLAVPANPLCSPTCKGLCPHCGGNITTGECTCDNAAPIDPRWNALRALLPMAEKT